MKPGDRVHYKHWKTTFTVLALTEGGDNVWVIEQLDHGLVWGGATGKSRGFTPRLVPASDLKVVG